MYFLRFLPAFFAHRISALPPISFKYDLYVAFNAEALPFRVSLCRHTDAYPAKAVQDCTLSSFPSKWHIVKKPETTEGFPSPMF